MKEFPMYVRKTDELPPYAHNMVASQPPLSRAVKDPGHAVGEIVPLTMYQPARKGQRPAPASRPLDLLVERYSLADVQNVGLCTTFYGQGSLDGEVVHLRVTHYPNYRTAVAVVSQD